MSLPCPSCPAPVPSVHPLSLDRYTFGSGISLISNRLGSDAVHRPLVPICPARVLLCPTAVPFLLVFWVLILVMLTGQEG
eukprot:466215-Amorphochlora_amoeboformis.AAC.1